MCKALVGFITIYLQSFKISLRAANRRRQYMIWNTATLFSLRKIRIDCRSQMFFRIDVHKNLAINIRRETPALESLFDNVAGLKTCNSIRKRLEHMYFPVNIVKFLRTAFFTEHFR